MMPPVQWRALFLMDLTIVFAVGVLPPANTISTPQLQPANTISTPPQLHSGSKIIRTSSKRRTVEASIQSDGAISLESEEGLHHKTAYTDQHPELKQDVQAPQDSAKSDAWSSAARAMAASAVNLVFFMPFHTIINFQYATGHGVCDSVRLLTADGFMRFFAGIGWIAPIILVKRFVEVILYQSWIGKSTDYTTALAVLSAAVGSAMTQVVIMPFDTMKTCSQSTGDCQNVKERISARGILACWDGVAVAAFASFLASLVFWGSSSMLDSTLPISEHGMIRNAIIGFLATVSCDVCVNVLRTSKVQHQSKKAHVPFKSTAVRTSDVRPWLDFVSRGLALRLILRGFEGVVFMLVWKGGSHHERLAHGSQASLISLSDQSDSLDRIFQGHYQQMTSSPQSKGLANPEHLDVLHLECALIGSGQDAGGYADAAETFLRVSDCFAQDLTGANAECKERRAADFVLRHLRTAIEDWESQKRLSVGEAITEIESIDARSLAEGHGWFEGDGDLKVILRAVGRCVSTLFAARQASVALMSFKSSTAVERRRLLLDRQKELKTKLAQMIVDDAWTGFNRSDFLQAWNDTRLAEIGVQKEMASIVQHGFLRSARKCDLNFDVSAMAVAYDLPQKKRISFDRSGALSKLTLGLDIHSQPISMPMVGLGTGFADCLKGHAMQQEFVGDVETAKVSSLLGSEECSDEALQGPIGWEETLSLVDTAALYGTESVVGAVLQRSKRHRQEYFVMTKLPTQAMQAVLHIKRGIDYLDQQLKDLQMSRVDALLLHHDGYNASEWKSIEVAQAHGRARSIGVSGVQVANEVLDCVKLGKCARVAMIAQDVWSPCAWEADDTNSEKAEAPALKAGTSLVATSTLHCQGEPHLSRIAGAHGFDQGREGQLGLVWALQTGAPVLFQTQQAAHLRENLDALKTVVLSEKEMAVLNSLSVIYALKDSPGDVELLKAMGFADTSHGIDR